MKKLNTSWQVKLMFASTLILFATTSAVAQENWGSGDEWRGQYKIGDKVQFSVSGNASDFQTCTVTENSPQAVMRVKCENFKQWSAGSYIVYGKNYIRPQQATKTANNKRQSQNDNDSQNEWTGGEEWRKEFEVGDKIQFSISGKAADFQPCTVAENNPQAVMRVKCAAFKQWEAGTYIVHSEENVRLTNTKSTNENNPNKNPTKPTTANSSGLKAGEYACYGSGGRIMIGLGFKVLSGNRYTDLEGGNPGTFVISGDTVKFRSGHLDGQTGRDLRNYSFTIGKQAQCEPF